MTKDELKNLIASKYESKMTPLDTGRYDPMYEIKDTDLLDICRSLRDDEEFKFNFLCNMSGVDTGEHFEIVYSLASTELKTRLDFKIILPREDNVTVESVTKIWKGANWFEREIWELFGINIKNHENLKRFLLPDDWDQGHPLRKDWDAPDFIRMPEL